MQCFRVNHNYCSLLNLPIFHDLSRLSHIKVAKNNWCNVLFQNQVFFWQQHWWMIYKEYLGNIHCCLFHLLLRCYKETRRYEWSWCMLSRDCVEFTTIIYAHFERKDQHLKPLGQILLSSCLHFHFWICKYFFFCTSVQSQAYLSHVANECKKEVWRQLLLNHVQLKIEFKEIP